MAVGASLLAAALWAFGAQLLSDVGSRSLSTAQTTSTEALSTSATSSPTSADSPDPPVSRVGSYSSPTTSAGGSRALTTSPPVSRSSPAGPARPAFEYLSDIHAVRESTDGLYDFDFGTATLNGKTYAHSVFDRDVFQKSSIEYDLGRHYDRFRSTVGVGDKSPLPTVLQFDVYLDDVAIFSQQVPFGSASQVDVPVINGLRLRLEMTNIPQGTRPLGLFGDARVFVKRLRELAPGCRQGAGRHDLTLQRAPSAAPDVQRG